MNQTGFGQKGATPIAASKCKSCPLDGDAYDAATVRFIERNGVMDIPRRGEKAESKISTFSRTKLPIFLEYCETSSGIGFRVALESLPAVSSTFRRSIARYPQQPRWTLWPSQCHGGGGSTDDVARQLEGAIGRSRSAHRLGFFASLRPRVCCGMEAGRHTG